MSTTFEKHRQALIQLIYELDKFTYHVLMQALREKLNWTDELGPAIDGTQTISDFLNELCQIGVLHYESGVYTVAKKVEI